MPENTETGEAQETQVAETTESATTSAPEESATPTTSENVWETPLIPAEPEAKTEPEPVAEDTKTEPLPVAPEGDDAEKVETEEEDEEPQTEEQVLADPNKPAPLSRRKAEKAAREVLEPLRDDAVPISEVFDRLHQFSPKRAEELAQDIAAKSSKAFPDEWLKAITGLDVTVDDVVKKFSGEEPTQANESDAFAQVVTELTDLYGEDWRDPSKDDQLLDQDRPYVQSLRSHLEQEAIRQGNLSEKDKEIESLKTELGKLRPEIDDIKTAQQQEVDARIESTYQESVKDFKSTIEKRSLGKLFKDSGLEDVPEDTDSVKAIKSFIRSRFDYDQSSDFDVFVMSEFSGREDAGKMIQRVDKYLKDASAAEVKASKTSGDKAEKLKREAEALRGEAKAEQDRLTVMHRKASQEFLGKLSPVMKVLEENADLQRRLALRPELVGQTTTLANKDAWKEKIDPKDPWKEDNLLSERLSATGR